MNPKSAILTVSFGTSYAQTRQMTIEPIENLIQSEVSSYFGDHFLFYHAWTSKIILRKISERDQFFIPTVREAFQQMLFDGISQVYVQPTHILPGVENEQMIQDAMQFHSDFDSIQFGSPLLTSLEDHMHFIHSLSKQLADLSMEEAVVLMGHGTSHFCNTAYAALDYEFKDQGYSNFFVGTVEAYPGLENILRGLKKSSFHRILLMPLMVVAGDHAQNDMTGSSPDSWENILKANGFQVRSHIQGLGELSFVRQMFADHLMSIIPSESAENLPS